MPAKAVSRHPCTHKSKTRYIAWFPCFDHLHNEAPEREPGKFDNPKTLKPKPQRLLLGLWVLRKFLALRFLEDEGDAAGLRQGLLCLWGSGFRDSGLGFWAFRVMGLRFTAWG